MTRPASDVAAGQHQPQADVPPADGGGRSPSLLFAAAPPTWGTEGQDEDRSFARDLNLDQIVATVAGDREEHDLITNVLFSPLHDADAVRYRQEVFQDLENQALFEEVQRFSELMGQVRAHLRQLAKMPYRHQREGWLLDAAAVYCDAVQSLAGHLASAQVSSRGLLSFRDYLVSYAASAGFTALTADTRSRKDALGRIRYCTRIRGGRVEVTRYESEADYSAAVLKTFERFKQGAVKKYRIRYRTWPGMNHVAAQILDLVARLFPEEFAALEEYCRRHATFLDESICRASKEFQFYLAYLGYIGPLRSAGLRFCLPEVSAASKGVRASDTFDLALARKLVAERKPVVTNDFRLDGRERILVVTGPNQGGKTTFARTFGQLHHLASVGCPVPGSTARLFLSDRLYTHFAREEDLTKMTGKLEDDLVRIGDILRAATGSSIVILNETFASTTLHDARFLGTKLLTKVIRLDALGVYVTFVDELASLGEQVVSMMSTIVPDNPAERAYKVVRKPADGLAYALALAEKHDVTYERLRSDGIRTLFATLQRELDDEYFEEISYHLKQLRFRAGVLISAEFDRDNSGVGFVLRAPGEARRRWTERLGIGPRTTYSFTLPPRDEAGGQILEDLTSRGINLVADAAAQSADHIGSYFTMLRAELGFYVSCLNLAGRLAAKEVPVTTPEPAQPSTLAFSCTDLRDACLELTSRDPVVGNDVQAEGKSLVIITGANSGGKSTFLRSVGVAQLMMQCGLFVTALSYRADAAREIFTHFIREEDPGMTSGRLDDELRRMSAIADRIGPRCLMLFNESFAGTNEREGSEIGRQVVRALLDAQIKVFFVTHRFDFAEHFYREHAASTLFLRAERHPDGRRNYKLAVKEPLPTSFGEDLYYQLGGWLDEDKAVTQAGRPG